MLSLLRCSMHCIFWFAIFEVCKMHSLHFGQACLQKHIFNKMYEQFMRHPKFFLYIYKGIDQKCGLHACAHCKELVGHGHLCYIQKPLHKNCRVISNNKDSEQSKENESNSPSNLLFWHGGYARNYDRPSQSCVGPIQEWQLQKTRFSKMMLLQMHDDKFCDWAFMQHCGHQKYQPLIFISHYLKGYDGYFVLVYVYLD